MPDSITYESWNCDLTDALPKRSYLYHLRPIGVGAAHVESLTGYIARLAEAHSVPTSVLLTRQLLPRLQQDHSTQRRALARNYAFIYDAYILNGIAACPCHWVRVLETLTGRNSLHALTMLRWSRVISDIHLLRNNRAWCPYCFDSWRNENLPVYEPLLWAIACVSICAIHQHRLETCCPHCKRGSQVLTAKARPGHCYRCRSWLGKSLPSCQSAAAASYDAELSVANAAGELLALAPGLPECPSSVYFKHNLRRSIHEFAAGNHSHFARMTAVSLDSVYRWLEVDRCIRLDSFLLMCCRLGFSAVRFLTEYIPANDLDWARARSLAQQISCRKPRRPASFYPQRVPERARNPDVSRLRTQNSIREHFEQVLCEPAPQALETVAKDFGFNNCSSLYNRCPDLCRAMVLKNRCWRQQEDERIHEAITKALLESPAPLMKEVASRLGYTVTALRARFPALSAALAARIPERRLFERERMRNRLQAALELNPAPPVKGIARFIGRDPSYLRAIFPELCRQITDRYVEETRKISTRRKLQFCAEIRSAVADLRERGINPSRKQVFAAIINPSMRSTHILDQQIAQTLRDL